MTSMNEYWTPEKAFEQGKLAYHCNAQLTDNHYDPVLEAEQRRSWDSGWYMAKIDELGPGY